MSPAYSFSISVHDLDAAGKVVRLPVPSNWMRSALEGTTVVTAGRDGELNVRISKSGQDVVIHGRLMAEVVVPCARCLEPAPVAVNEPLSILAVPVASAAQKSARREEEEDVEIAEDHPDLISYEGDAVVLDDLVRDELLLGIPMIPLCSEACPGISPKEYQNATEPPGIDPRLQPLLRLKKNST
ncbi:MAG: DUF177 domain-containing protein [Myxococcota bacterium]|nr:DUF177 domain-containing protein [Myxococcota bacterium]